MLNEIFSFLHQFSGYAPFIAFFAALIESIVGIGYFFPATTTVFVMGIMSGQGFIPFNEILFSSFAGAFFGDQISFHLGKKYKEKIVSLLHLSTAHIEKVENLLNKGAFSIFFGRLMPVIKENIAFAAGIINMKYLKFIFWDALGAFAWSLQYVGIGYLFSSSLALAQIWLERTTFIIVAVIAFFVFIYIGLILLKKYIPVLKSILYAVYEEFLQSPKTKEFIQNHPKLVKFLKERFNTSSFYGLPLTLLSFVFLYIFGLFAGIIEDFLTKDPIVNVDKIIANYVPLIRNEYLTKFFTYITYFGTAPVVIAFLISVGFILIVNKKARYLLPLLISTAGAAISVHISKMIFHRPRPDIAIYYEPSFSFPSGHAAIAAACYGFAAYLIMRFVKNTKTKFNVLFLSLTFIFLLGISRIYLGEHYLSDVYSGYLLGTLWFIIGIAVTKVIDEKYKIVQTKLYNKIFTFFVVLGFITFYIGFAKVFHYKLNHKTEIKVVKINSLKKINPFTQSIIGINTWPVNVIFIGKFEKTKKTLIKKGWKITKIPLPVFWNYKRANITLKKEGYILKLWKSRYIYLNNKVIVGVIVKFNNSSLIPRFLPDIDDARKFLEKEFRGEKIQLVKPYIGIDILGNNFFTDGKCLVIDFN